MSEEKADISKELFDSVCDAVGPTTRHPSLWRVSMETRGDKMEPRILALVSYRAFLLTARLPTKVEHSFSYLDLKGVTSTNPTKVVLESERAVWTLQLGSVEQVDQVLVYMGTSLIRICPNGPALKALRKLVLSLPDRTLALQASLDQQSPTDPGPCGGFSHQYWCVCDQLGLPYRDEVQWDVDTIYLTQDTRDLNLQDFNHLENRDLVAILAVLEYNQWFTKISTKDYKLSSDVWEQVLRVVARSSCLEELLLDNAGLKSDFAVKLAAALLHNPACSLHTLNMPNNTLEDKGVCALSAQLAKLPLGLKHLNLSKNSLSAKGVNTLCMALCANPTASSSLSHLDLSANSLKGDELPNLHNFLSQPNCVETLDLSNSDCALDQVCASLLKGSLVHLKVLNMSKTVFSHRRSKEVSPTFKQFFSSSEALKSVSLSATRLPLEALKSLLLGLGCNPNLSEVSLDISCCELRSGGSQILEGCIAEIPNISSLDISDNGLDLDLSTLLVWLARNRSIQHLSLGKNFSNIKSKNISHVLDNLVHLIQEEESPLCSLSLADSRLKADLGAVLSALGSNASLTRLDLSGNAMGDMGAKMLAKALQINTKLRTLIWDRNNISPQGLQDVAAALEKNHTIRFMPIPIVDAAQALKTSPEKTEDALLKMEQYLLRNHETRKYLQEQAYRLQQGIVTTTTQQLVDRVCVKVQDHLNSLRFSENPDVQEDMRAAKNLMKDARNAKKLLPNLYHLQGTGARGPCVEAIQETLESMAGEVSRVIDQQLQVLLCSMVDTAESVCPHVMRRSSRLREELVEACAGRMVVPRSFVSSALLEQSGVDIINKISEVKLGLASLLSDHIVDQILDSLSVSQHTLASHVTQRYTPLLRSVPPVEAEVLDETVLDPRDQDPLDPQDPREDPPRMNPCSKRKSILVRMLRPVSVAFEMEFDLDRALEEVPLHEEDLPPPPPPAQTLRDSRYYADLPPPPSSAQLRPLCPLPPTLDPLAPLTDPLALPLPPLTLPSAEGVKLKHRTKLRPKPPNRTKPSRARRPLAAEQNLLMEKLDDGLEDFYHRTVNTLRQAPPGGATQEVTDKKRESRKSGLLQLLKSRGSRSSTSSSSSSVTGTALETGDEPRPKDPPAESEPPMPKTTSPKNLLPAPPTEVEEEKEKEEEEEEKQSPHPALHHYGVPVLGLDLMAEMKARQERMAATQKAGELCVVDPPLGDASPEDQRPEPAPRSKPQTFTPRPPRPAPGPRTSDPTSRPDRTSGPEVGMGAGETAPPPAASAPPPSPPPTPSPVPPPAPAPRLRRSPSNNQMEDSTDQRLLDSPEEEQEEEEEVRAVGGRRCSSLKTASPPKEEQNRQRTNSLPNHGPDQREEEIEEDSSEDEEPSL